MSSLQESADGFTAPPVGAVNNCLDRPEKAEPQERYGAEKIIPKLAQPALGDYFPMVVRMFAAHQPHVHGPMAAVFHKGGE